MADDARDLISRAESHLERALTAAWGPVDWADLSVYGFYALETAVMAAGAKLGWSVQHTHTAKLRAAQRLHVEVGLPDIAELLVDLNTARKSVAYGDVDIPDLDAEDLAIRLEEYVEAARMLVLQ